MITKFINLNVLKIHPNSLETLDKIGCLQSIWTHRLTLSEKKKKTRGDLGNTSSLLNNTDPLNMQQAGWLMWYSHRDSGVTVRTRLRWNSDGKTATQALQITFVSLWDPVWKPCWRYDSCHADYLDAAGQNGANKPGTQAVPHSVAAALRGQRAKNGLCETWRNSSSISTYTFSI